MLPKRLRPFFWYFVRKRLWWFVAFQFFCLAWALDQTVFPYIFKLIIDKITTLDDVSVMWQVLMPVLLSGIGFWLYLEVSYRANGMLLAKLSPETEADIRMEMLDYVQDHSIRFFANNFAGAMGNKLNDMPRSASQVIRLMCQLFVPAVVASIIAVSVFVTLQPLFGAILLLWIMLHMGVCFFCAKRCDYLSEKHSELRSTLTGKVVDSLSNSVNVKLFARKPHEMEYVGACQAAERNAHFASLWYIEKIRLVLGALSFFIPGICLNGYMLYSFQQGTISVGDVVYIFSTSWNIMFMIWISGIELPNLYKELGVCRQALSLIEAEHDIVDVDDAGELVVKKGEIAFDNVTFRYRRNQNVFDNKTVTIEAGTKVGLVGFSGSGKTTFVNLIMRFYDIESGKILIDGQDISKVTRDSLRSVIAMIPQDPTLFHRSLMDNIRYGKLDASDEDVINAACNAHCAEFIGELEEGYDAMVGERGVKLSGGQRQRIAIARAILKDAPILILDEATSALDSVTEKQIQDGLAYLMEGKTTIVIAHRLSTLSDMDRILVFDKGHIVEDGTHEALLKKKGHYSKLWDMQAGGFLPE